MAECTRSGWAAFTLGATLVAGCGGRVDVKSEKQDLGNHTDAPTNPAPMQPAPIAGDAIERDAGADVRPAQPAAPSVATPSMAAPTVGTVTVGTATVGTPSVVTPSVAPAAADDALQSISVPSESWIDLNDLETSEADGGLALFGVPADAGPDFVPGDLTLLVVFDNSGSMAAPWNEETRWVVANRTLIAQALWPVRDVITVGAIRFPLQSNCGVPDLDSGLQFQFTSGTEFIDSWVQAAYAPQGSTPLAQAFAVADQVIRAAGSETGLDRGRRFRVMVITDGEPNCDGDLTLLEALPAAWQELGIDTHVIGLPGSHPAAELLDRIAIAGGTEKHQTAGDPEEFAAQVARLAR